ncbi:MAG: hypothetical protein Q8N45_11365, partial [Anaerolineales bacterium]|nr:hypothetical protein [Anaerolineales bacterium]
ISYFIALMDRPGRFAWGVFFACILAGLCVMGAIWLIRVNARNKQAGAEAVDILRGRLQSLSVQ